MISKKTLAAAVVAGAAATAPAQVLMQMLDFGLNTPDFEQTLTFNQFDIDPAHILSVKYTVELDIAGGNLTVDNDGVDGAIVDVELGASAELSSTDVTLLNDMLNPVVDEVELVTTDTLNLAGNDGDDDTTFDPNGGPDEGSIDGGMQSGMSMGFINSMFFGQYAGMGTFDILVDVDQVLDFGSQSGVSGGFTPVQASGKVKIEVTLIPTPATAAMLGMGGLVAVRRRR